MDGEDNEVPPFIGDIYRKCAAFFSEISGIDNILSSESIEYAENKLWIAKAKAKEACSNFMQETYSDFFTYMSQEARPALEENGCYGVHVSEMLKSDEDHANEQIIPSYCSSTKAKQTEDDLAGEKEPNVTVVNDSCSMLDETKMVVQPTPKMHVLSTGLTSLSAVAIEKKCNCSEANESEDGDGDGDGSACPRRKHQRQNSEESEWQDGDFSESDWEII